MSRDQKPGKVKIYSGGQAPAHPLRRASDLVEGDPIDEGETVEIVEPAPTGGMGFLFSLLFLFGCIAGGSAFVILPTL